MSSERDHDLDIDVAVRVHTKALDIWRQLKGMPDYEAGGTVLALAAMFIACYPEDRRPDMFDMFGDATARMFKLINSEVIKGKCGEDGWVVDVAPEVTAFLVDHPDAKEGMTEALARIKQTLEGVDMTDREAVEAAMTAIGASRVSPEEVEEITAKKPSLN